MKKMKLQSLRSSFIVCFGLAGLLLLQGCAAGIATGVGAAAGVASAQEGGLSRAARDARIQAEINDLWFKYNVQMFSKVDMTVNNGRVLLTGIVQNPEHRVEAVRLAWQPEGVTQVINEINIADGEGITGFARDVWTTSRLRSMLMFNAEVQSVNYNIDTVKGTVYLMGYAQDQFELNRVVEIARSISGVKQVVSYVKLVGDDDVSGSRDPQALRRPAANKTQAAIERQEIEGGGNGPVVIAPEFSGDASSAQSNEIESENLIWNDR